jgi:predicted ATPase
VKITSWLGGVLHFQADENDYTFRFQLLPDEADSLVFVEELVHGFKSDGSSPILHGGLLEKTSSIESRLKLKAQMGDATARELYDLLSGFRVYHFHDTSSLAKIRLTSDIGDNHEIAADGGNLASMLHLYKIKYPMIYRRIISTIQKILPGFDDFVLVPEELNSQSLFLNWKQTWSDYLLHPYQISDGSLRAMALITLLMQPKKRLPKIVVLDEPELGLHPHAVEIVAGLIRSASLDTQVIVATQSSALLDYFEPEEIIVVDCLDGESKFSRLSSADLEGWLSRYSIGELWEKNVVGGGPLR